MTQSTPLTRPVVKVRDSNIELFRIISMFLIVAHHYVYNSGLLENGPIYADPTAPASVFLALWGAFGKIGINCFVMITGYFMCTSNISAKKFAKLLLEVVFYRIIISSIFWISGYERFSLTAFVKTLLITTKVSHNFTGTFLLFFLCIPFLNVLIHHLTEKQHIRLLLLTTFIYVFFGTLPFFSVTMNYVSWYMVLYFTASYFRLYPKRLFSRTGFWGIAVVGCILLCCASVVLGLLVYAKFGKNMTYYFVTDSNTLLAYLTGICGFMFFKNLKIKPSRVINTISSTTFGVLLIHANSDTMRRWLWSDVLQNVRVYSTKWVYLHAIGSVLIVFAVCAAIDLARIHLIEKPFFVWWDKRFDKFAQKYASLENKLCQKLKIGVDEENN